MYFYFDNPLSFQKALSIERCIQQMKDEENNVQLIINWLQERNLAKRFRQELVARISFTKGKLFPVTYDKNCRKLWRNTFRAANIPILFNKHIDNHYKKKHLALLLGIYAPLKRIYHICK